MFINICVVTSNRTTRPRKGACRPTYMMNLPYVAVIKDTQIVGRTPLEFYSQITWCYITQRGYVNSYPASVMLLGEGGKEKA